MTKTTSNSESLWQDGQARRALINKSYAAVMERLNALNETPARKIIATGTIVSSWYETRPPNGCLPAHTERRATHVEIYEADFYGKGSKLYARGYSTLEQPDYRSSGVKFDFWDDGDPERVNKWLERIRKANQ